MTTIHDQVREKTALAETYGESGAMLSAARCLIAAAALYLRRHQEVCAPMQEPDQPPIWEPLVTAAIDRGFNFGEAVRVFAAKQRAEEPELAAYADAATERYHRDGELEFDHEAMVSKGEDAGAYVMGWRWIEDDDAGIETEEDEEEDSED